MSTDTADNISYKPQPLVPEAHTSTLKADFANLGHAAADVARSGLGELRDGAKHAADAAKDKLGAAKDAAGEAVGSVTEIIKRHPLTSIGIVAGLGIIVGLVVSRNRS